jgi:hypothetical protein
VAGFCGMETGRAREVARLLRTQAEVCADAAVSVCDALAVTSWQGPDAEAFRRELRELTDGPLTGSADGLGRQADLLLKEANAQDLASAAGIPGRPESTPDGAAGPGPAACAPGTLPQVDTAGSREGYRHENSPFLPDVLEDPFEQELATMAGGWADVVDRGMQDGIDRIQQPLDDLGLRTDGVDQFQDDLLHLNGIMRDWSTGERVPTISELGAAGLVTGLSGGVAGHEMLRGKDTPFLDDRPGGTVHDVRTDTTLSAGPRDLQDLVMGNDALRGHPAVDAGQVGIQEVVPAGGTRPVYIVQVPPTEGRGITEVPGAWGEQGNSRDWGENLREVAGQDPAALDDVRAAMAAPGADGRPLVPPGSRVMLVGHSQGGIIAAHLAADPGFNNSSGAAGSYDVTRTFSVGSPVQTIVPAQPCTEVVNVTHGPVQVHTDGTASGDPIGHLDLQGAQIGGGALASPNVHEVVLDGGYEQPLIDRDEGGPVGGDEDRRGPGERWLETNHDSVGEDHDPAAGYAGTVGRQTATDPTLAALQQDLEGTYLGAGTTVTASHVVTVGRGAP